MLGCYKYIHIYVCVCMCVCVALCVVAQSCPTLCDPMDRSPSRLLCPWGFSRQRILEWVAMPSSRGSSQPRAQTCDSYVSCIDRRVFFLSFFFFLPLALSGKPGSLSVILYLCDQYQYISALNSFVCTCFLPTLAI